MKYNIKEVYDGRLPEYQIIAEDGTIVKIFDTIEEAEKFIQSYEAVDSIVL